MTRDVISELEEMMKAIEDAPEHIRDIAVDIEQMFDEACDNMARVEESYVRQFVPDYDVDGHTALNDLLRASEEKSRIWMMSSLIAYATEGSAAENFPENFADGLKAAAKPADRELPEGMTEHVRAFNSLTTDQIDLTLDKGVSVLRNEISSLRWRDFSRRVESYLGRDNKPELVVT